MSKLQQILAIIRMMTVDELTELYNQFGFNISTSTLWEMFRDLPSVNAPSEKPEVNHSGRFQVFLYNNGMNGKFIQCIKLYREHTGFGLKEAKDAVDNAKLGGFSPPLIIEKSVPLYIAQAIKDHWQDEGVDVQIETARF